MEKNEYSRILDKLQEEIKKRKKKMTTRSFKGQMVFVHHEDGSYFIFYDAFVHKISITHNDEESGQPYDNKFHVVFSRYIEPQAYRCDELCLCVTYGESYEKTWEKDKVYRPRIIHKPASDYLKKNGRKLYCKDFNYDTVLVDFKWYVIMSLNHAKVEIVDDTTYIFTEHQGYYAFKNDEINISVKIRG